MALQDKPSWASAPDWANHLAMDEDGSWWWYDTRPKLEDNSGQWVSVGRMAQATDCETRWDETHSTRPQV